MAKLPSDRLRFLSEAAVRQLGAEHATPFYVYSRSELHRAAEEAKQFAAAMPFGGTVRYAVKANDHPEVLQVFDRVGLSFDASSSFEAEHLIKKGIEPAKILLTSQQLPKDVAALLDKGVQITATSLHQLETICRAKPGNPVSVRINPGMGDGLNNRLTTGGVSASFGIWYEYIPKVLQLAEVHGNKIERLHMHIGTGTDPVKWVQAVRTCLEMAQELPTVTILDIGGGFKTAYMSGDEETNMRLVGEEVAKLIRQFEQDTGRKLHIEIEPGRFLAVHAGSIITSVIDVTDTGDHGYKFVRTDTGMTEILRPAMYGAQHQLVVVPKESRPAQYDDYVVVGHCCESGDCLTVAKDDPETIEPRLLLKPEIGDLLVIESAGAYCASMATTSYNAFPKAKEIVID